MSRRGKGTGKNFKGNGIGGKGMDGKEGNTNYGDWSLDCKLKIRIKKNNSYDEVGINLFKEWLLYIVILKRDDAKENKAVQKASRRGPSTSPEGLRTHANPLEDEQRYIYCSKRRRFLISSPSSLIPHSSSTLCFCLFICVKHQTIAIAIAIKFRIQRRASVADD